ncbi:MAG: isoprenylcysteine carboxylmethyltransferase family protein [Croceibacterium sp.]
MSQPRAPRYAESMMPSFYWRAALALWTVWFASWWVAALWRDKAKSEAPRASWRWPMVLVGIGFFLLFWQRRGGPLPLWHTGPALGWSMVGLIAASFAFSWWARVTMGRMWSGGIMRTAGHRVIQHGPFAWTRHPIYTALIGAGFGLAVIKGTLAGLAGATLLSLGFYFKARVEERFLTEQLTGYPDYRARVPMLLPLAKAYNSRLS